MSEYQYYEFVAIDGPISDEGWRYARGCSSRAQVSRFRWHNVYHFGDFHGNAETLLNYYDAHFYIANWASVRLGLALPAATPPRKAVEPYLRKGRRYEVTLTLREVNGRCLVWWDRNEEGGWWEAEGEGAIDQLIGIREELLRGDYRALFLGWLADFDPEESMNSKDQGALLPPVPAGLDQLSPAQTALVRYFPVDGDVLAVAASLSPTSILERLPAATVIQGLSVSEMRDLLERVAEGQGSKVMAELSRLATPPPSASGIPTLSCWEFAAKILQVREARCREEARAKAAQRKREAEARRERLTTVKQQADTIWSSLDGLMNQKTTAAYEQVAAHLEELRDAYDQANECATFQRRLATFREHYAHRPAMMRRIREL